MKNKITRRDLFKRIAKTLPMIALTAIPTITIFASEPMGCRGGCSDTCRFLCAMGCTAKCMQGCVSTCRGECKGTVRVLVNYLGNVIIVQISVKGDVMVLVTEHVSLCQQEWIL